MKFNPQETEGRNAGSAPKYLNIKQAAKCTPENPVGPRDVRKTPPDSPPQTPSLWTVRDVANFLVRSERWVWTALRYQETEEGSIPCHRLPGGSPRFDAHEIEEWVKSGCPPVATFKSWQGARKR